MPSTRRLTRRDPEHPNVVHTECENCVNHGEKCTGWDCATVLAKRLAEFEDHGVNPDQIRKLEAVAQNAAFVVNGYAFVCQSECIQVTNLNNLSKTASITRLGQVLDTSMDDIEINIALAYWNKNKQFAED